MKKIIFLLVVCFPSFLFAQRTIKANRIEANEMRINGFKINLISADTSFANPSDLVLPTQKAIKFYFENHVPEQFFIGTASQVELQLKDFYLNVSNGFGVKIGTVLLSREGGNHLGVKFNGIEHFRFMNSGNLGLGITNPVGQIHINNVNPYFFITDSNADANYHTTVIDNTAGWCTFQTRNSAWAVVSTDYDMQKNNLGVISHVWYTAGIEAMKLDINRNLEIDKKIRLKSDIVDGGLLVSDGTGLFTPTSTIDVLKTRIPWVTMTPGVIADADKKILVSTAGTYSLPDNPINGDWYVVKSTIGVTIDTEGTEKIDGADFINTGINTTLRFEFTGTEYSIISKYN